MNEITEQTLIPKELADMIEEEISTQYQKGMEIDSAINVGTLIAVNKWRKKNADKGRR